MSPELISGCCVQLLFFIRRINRSQTDKKFNKNLLCSTNINQYNVLQKAALLYVALMAESFYATKNAVVP